MAQTGRAQTPSYPGHAQSYSTVDGAQENRRASFSPRKSSLAQPTIRMQQTPSSPTSMSSPRPGVSRSSSGQIDSYSAAHSRSPSQHSSIKHLSSITQLSLNDEPLAGADDDGEVEPLPMLQYHHKPIEESPIKKNNPHRASQMTVNSIGSSSSGGGGQNGHLRLPRTSGPRAVSQYSLGADLRASTYSPLRH